MEKRDFPAIFVATAIVVWFGVIALGHLALNKPLIFVTPLELPGRDYLDFFRASSYIVSGGSPYDAPDEHYITTPVPAIFNIILLPFGFKVARLLLLILIPLSIAFSFTRFTAIYDLPSEAKGYIFLAGLSALLFGYPFYFLIERGNIDGWVFCFLGLGLYFLYKAQNEGKGALFLSLAMAFKLYPLLLVIPVFIYRKWRLLFFICLWGIVWFSTTFPYTLELQNILTERTQGYFRIDENGSLTSTVALALVALDAFLPGTLSFSFFLYTPVFASVLYSMFLSAVILSDYKIHKLGGKLDVTTIVLYLPFMVAVPQVVYHYSLIICLLLIPTICHLWSLSTDLRTKRIFFVIMVGIACTQWQATASSNLSQNILALAIPGLGLLLIIAGITAYKLLLAKSLQLASV